MDNNIPNLPFPPRKIIIGVAVIILVVVLGFLIRGATHQQPPIPVPAPVPAPSPIPAPIVRTEQQAVQDVKNIPGYQNATTTDMQQIKGADGQMYWAVKTSKGWAVSKVIPNTPATSTSPKH